MSHYCVVALVPKDIDPENIEPYVEHILEPFSEHNEVEEYDTECYCINREAEEKCRLQMDWSKRLDAKRAELLGKGTIEEDWSTFIDGMYAQLERLTKRHPLYNLPNPKCETCQGTGEYTTTSNPDGHWDWFVIGGRWDGWIFGQEHCEKSSDENGFNFDDSHHTVENNSRPVSEIPADDEWYTPYAVITPDGDWHSKGTMLMFGCSTDEQNDWNETVKKLYADNADCLAVTVDCHC